MSSLTTKQKIDALLKSVIDDGIGNNVKFDYNNRNHLYVLGKRIENELDDIIDKRKQYGGANKEISFKYVSWKWYDYILTKLDNNFWWELSRWSDNYQIVEVKMVWNNKEYRGCYAVENSSYKKDTKEPLNNLGEMVVNEGMRCFAKLASRATGLFYHLWLEGSND